MAILNLNTPAALDIIAPHSYALDVVLNFFNDDDDEPYALEGSFAMKVTRDEAGHISLLDCTVTVDDNKLIVAASKEAIAGIPAGEYFYDIRHTTTEGEQRLFAGRFIVNKTQTK